MATMSAAHTVQVLCLMGLGVLLCASRSSAQSQPQLNLMPYPAQVEPGSGFFNAAMYFTVTVLLRLVIGLSAIPGLPHGKGK